MTTKAKAAVEASAFLEQLLGGPLTFGKNLRAIREGDGLTQAAFAEKLGVSKQNLSDIENERRNVSVERAAEWAKKLGYSTAQFVRLALQAEVNAAGLDLVVEVETPKKKRRAA
ncbi:MAG: helix-turn-helix transcriptional regulator [Polyangiales bacterium]